MNIPREQPKYGHCSGHSDFCYSADGRQIISCGSDGDIRIWRGFSDNDPTTTCAGSEWARSIKQIGDYVYCSTEDSKVQVLTYPDLERSSVLIRPTAPVNQIVASKDNKFVAICSEDMTVKLVNLETNEMSNFYGLTGVGLSVSICPKMELLASSSSEGKLRIFKISDQVVLKEVKCNYKTNCFDNAKSLARIQFEPVNGNELAYPDNDAVYIMDVSSWEIKKTLICTKLEGALFSIVEYSPCGRKIAVSTADGDIAVWNVQSGEVIGISLSKDQSGCTSLCWNPTNNGELLYSDKTGCFGVLKIVTNNEKQRKDPTNQHNILSTTDGIHDVDIDDDLANDIFADVDDRDDDELAFTKVASDDDDDDDENVVSINKLKRKYLGDGGADSASDKYAGSKKSRSPSPRPRTPQTPLQEPFMPTSSPEHLDRRYMCWNHIAVIRCYNSTSDDDLNINKSIEVDFHDSTFHSNITIQNFNDCTMGSVSATVLVTANNKQLQAMPLTASTKKWAISVREIENIICLSTSDNMICIGIDSNLVHVYTVYGNQKSVLSTPGPIVTMSSHGHYLLVAYHQSGVRVNDQVMGIMMVKFDGMNMDCRYLNAPLSPGSTLKWLGFSDKGSPGIFDSDGVLFLYLFVSNVWIPFLDTKLQFSSPSDTLFVSSVHETSATIRGTKCRSGVYPVFVPRPSLLELPLQPPFVEISTDKGALESNLFIWSSLKVDDTDKKFKETALKSFALSCKSDIDMRAFELIENLKDPQIVNLAIKYATKMQRKRLVEKLMQIETDNEEENLIEAIVARENHASEISNKSNNRVLKPKENARIMLSQKKREKTSAQETKTPARDITEAVSQEIFCTPTEDSQNVQTLTANSEEIVESPVVFHQKLPFLKSANKEESKTYNPLSLTDTFAGIGKLDSKSAEKRKKPDDSSTPEPKQEKQRKLDRFIFSKRK